MKKKVITISLVVSILAGASYIYFSTKSSNITSGISYATNSDNGLHELIMWQNVSLYVLLVAFITFCIASGYNYLLNLLELFWG